MNDNRIRRLRGGVKVSGFVCGPGFNSQTHHLCFYSQIHSTTCHCIEKRKKIT